MCVNDGTPRDNMGICRICVYALGNAVKYDEDWIVTNRYCSYYKEWIPADKSDCEAFEQNE